MPLMSDYELNTDPEEVEEGDAYRRAAKRLFCDKAIVAAVGNEAAIDREGDIEIDAGAPVSGSNAPGAYVQAWVYVPRAEMEKELNHG